MKVEYNRKSKKYEIVISLTDKCFSCGNKSDCKMLQLIESGELLLRKSPTYITDCKLYFYLVAKEIEDKMQGFFFGSEDDRGFKDNYKYK